MIKQRYKSENRGFFAEMNFTPFIDIIFVMMIIFMITAPFSEQSVDVQLPKESAKDISAKAREMPTISITKDKRIFLDNRRITLDDLENQLKTRRMANSQLEVFLKSDRMVPYGEVIKVMARIKKAGIEKLGMITEKPGN